MKIVVTGAGGQVGRELVERLHASPFLFAAFDHAGLDISDAAAVRRVLSEGQAGLVINTAAYTAVDRAEQEPELAYAVNRDGPTHLAAACRELGIPLLHISTDYVFDGRKSGPYREQDASAPASVYGKSKWEGEQAIRAFLREHLILRVSWVFGAYGHNFVKTMLRLAGEREELRVVADQLGCPTHAGAIAETLLALSQRFADGQTMHWGTYHYSGKPATSWHGFACAIVEQARAYQLPLQVQTITPITTAEFPTPAPRPANSVLDCSALANDYGLQAQAWRQGLAAMLKTLVRE